MSEDLTKEIEELREAQKRIKNIQKGNSSPEVVDAIIRNITEEEIEYDQVAKPARPSKEIQPDL